MGRLFSLIVVLMASVLLVTACGDGSTPTLAQAPTVQPHVEEGTLEEGAGPLSFLFFMEASSGKYASQGAGSSDFKLTLNDPAPLVVFFTDRPHRIAGHEPLEDFLAGWEARGFGDVPPNATLVVPATESAAQTVLVAEIMSPKWDAETRELVFDGALIHAHEVAGQGYSEEAMAMVPESLEAIFLFIDTVSDGCSGPGMAPAGCFTICGGPFEPACTY